MDFISLLGFAGAVLMGIVLGALGGGGAILSVPILVAAFGFQMKEAAVASYFILLFSAGLGMWKNRSSVVLKKALWFSIFSLITLWLVRMLVVPLIPEQVLWFGRTFTSHELLLFLLVAVIFAVAISMLKKKKEVSGGTVELVVSSVLVGTLGALVGAGGGFLIVPALLGQKGMTMKQATATSFVVIAANAITGIASSWSRAFELNWQVLAPFIGFGVFGVFLGGVIAKRTEDKKLKIAFNALLFVVGVGMIVQELMTNT